MNFVWHDSSTYTHYRCTSDRPVKIKVRDFGELSMHDATVTDMGYVLFRDGRFMACIYGSVHPESPGRWFDNIDEAKRYVEEQALIGLALNKLTR